MSDNTPQEEVIKIATVKECFNCKGKGTCYQKMISRPCPICNGNKYVMDKMISILELKFLLHEAPPIEYSLGKPVINES